MCMLLRLRRIFLSREYACNLNMGQIFLFEMFTTIELHP